MYCMFFENRYSISSIQPWNKRMCSVIIRSNQIHFIDFTSVTYSWKMHNKGSFTSKNWLSHCQFILQILSIHLLTSFVKHIKRQSNWNRYPSPPQYKNRKYKPLCSIGSSGTSHSQGRGRHSRRVGPAGPGPWYRTSPCSYWPRSTAAVTKESQSNPSQI